MPNAREIQSRMKSIQDTMKITNAMYMISSSKLKKAKKTLADTEPYFYMLQSTIGRILRHFPELRNQYFDQRSEIPDNERKIAYIVITADKGLAGAYNHNIIKLAEESLEKNEKNKLFIVGELGRQYFSKADVDVEENFQFVVQSPSMSRARNIAERVMQMYIDRQVDEVKIIYTRMVSAMETDTEVQEILPLTRGNFNAVKLPIDVHMEEIKMYPSPAEVINNIVPNYVAGFIYGALVESYSSEQNSRMMAMQAATNSAQRMLKELSLIYNRVRQAAITQEITEVVGGAKAQKKKKLS